MAKVTLVFYDDPDGNCAVEVYAEPNFDAGDSDAMTLAQHTAMRVMAEISDDDDVVIAGEEHGIQ